MDADERQIRDLIAGWMAATKAGDVERVLDMVADDALFLTPGNPTMTKDDFAKSSRSMVASGVRIEGSSDVQELHVVGDWAFARSHLTVKVTPADGEAMSRQGDVLTIFSRQGGRWLLFRDANLLAQAKPPRA